VHAHISRRIAPLAWPVVSRTAFGLLIWGQTVLRDSLKGVAFLAYWGCCFFFTLAAIITALLDVRATRRKAREEQDDLIRRTLEEVENESKDHPKS
jgi:hypothetical protein